MPTKISLVGSSLTECILVRLVLFLAHKLIDGKSESELLTLSGPQSRFWDKLLIIRVLCPHIWECGAKGVSSKHSMKIDKQCELILNPMRDGNDGTYRGGEGMTPVTTVCAEDR